MNKKYPGPECGYFKDVKSRGAIGQNLPLIRILTAIKSGEWKEPIETIRAARNSGDENGLEARVKALKRELPAFMMSATTTNGRHRIADCGEHTGIIQIDVDDIGPVTAVALRERLAADHHVLAAWISPGGHGLKIAARISATLDTHNEAWQRAAGYMGAKFGITLDPAPKAVNALCFVGFDPNMILKPWDEVVPLPCKIEVEIVHSKVEIVHSNAVNSDTQETQRLRGKEVFLCSDFDVMPFVATGRGQSNRVLFNMARHLKTFERNAGGTTSFDERTDVFVRWWEDSEKNVDPSLG